MKSEKICSVFGHSEILKEDKCYLKPRLEREFLNLILNHGVKKFLFGGFGEFDDLCYQVVCELKNQFEFIERIHCVENERLLRPDKQPIWLKNRNYEQIIYLEPDFKYWYTQIYYRNLEMIKASDFIIFYVRNRNNSGAFKSFKFAKKIKKMIIEI